MIEGTNIPLEWKKGLNINQKTETGNSQFSKSGPPAITGPDPGCGNKRRKKGAKT